MDRRLVAAIAALVAICVILSKTRRSPPSPPSPSPPETVSKPHIIMLLADDLGWANVGWHSDSSGNYEAKTPVLDSLVKHGVELNRHYSFKYCSPSRSALQSGRNPIHVNVLNTDPSWWNPMDNVSGFAGVPRKMTGMGQLMKNGGYRTHFVGKWDVGMATKDHTPKGRGYDTSLGYFYHLNDYWNFTVDDDGGAGPQSCSTAKENNAIVDLWMSNETYEGPAFELMNNITRCSPGEDNAYPSNEEGCVYEDFLFSRHVRSLVDDHSKNHARKSFFLCYAPHVAHEPLQVPRDYLQNFSHIDNERRRRYAAMVYLLDQQIGVLVQQLKDRSMWENTIFVFASDNGGPIYRFGTPGANNNPLRGGKASNFEGGIRVSSFVAGGALPVQARGTKKEGLSTLWDWYSTFASIAGVDAFDARAAGANLNQPDNFNLWPYIAGQTLKSPRSEIALGCPSGWKAVWSGPSTSVNGIIVDEGADGLWKLLVNEIPMNVWTGPSFPDTTDPSHWAHSPENLFAHCGDGCLFNLTADPAERVDLAASFPEKLKRLKERAGFWNGTVFSPVRGSPQTSCCATAQTKYKNFWGPFLEIDSATERTRLRSAITI